MAEHSELAIVFEALKLLRRARVGDALSALSNGALYKIAQSRKTIKEDGLPEAFGIDSLSPVEREELAEVVRLFSKGGESDNITATARRKIEEIELRLYQLLISHLKGEYGESWWFRGVPEAIRVRAAQLHEESEGEIAKESALYLRDLKDIACSEWGKVKDMLGDSQESKRSFSSRIDVLMELRNRLSHPVRLEQRPVDESEVELLDEWLSCLEEFGGSGHLSARSKS